MNSIENKRHYPHVLDASDSKRMKKTDSTSTLHSINYVAVPSLQNIAILNVATGLWKQSDITEAMHRRFISSAKYEFEILQLKLSALKKLSLLPLPNLLKEEVFNVIQPLLKQIFEWMHNEYQLDWDKIPSVYWTNKGIIDKIKTLKQLIHSNSIREDIYHFFKLACKYCSEDSIPYLWDELLKLVRTDELDLMETVETYNDHFRIYWISILRKESSLINPKIQHTDYDGIYDGCDNVYKNMFTLATKTGNIEAVKYFFNKFTTEEKSYNLAQWIKDAIFHLKKNQFWSNIDINKYSDVLYFLLSQMDDAEQQREVILKNSAVILSSLFKHWSLRKFLLPTIRTIWSSLDETVYVELLNEVGRCCLLDQTAHKLLRKLCLESPENLKKYFIKCSTDQFSKNYSNVICNLLQIKDVETVKLMLNYADVDEKKMIIFSLIETKAFLSYIMSNRDELFLFDFDIFIGETLSPAHDDIKVLKAKIIQKHGNRLFYVWIGDENWQMVEEFFKWAFSSQDQIDQFKNQILKTSDVTSAINGILFKYDLMGKFIEWCHTNEAKINEKVNNFNAVQLVLELSLFEEFVDWYFVSEETVDDRVVAFLNFFKRKNYLI